MTFFFIDVFLIIGGYFLLKPLFTDSYNNSRYITYTLLFYKKKAMGKMHKIKSNVKPG